MRKNLLVVLCLIGCYGCVSQKAPKRIGPPPMPVVIKQLPIVRPDALTPFLRAGVPASPSVKLAWDASPDASVVGYRIYWGGKSGMYTNSASVGNVTTATMAGLETNATYYFAAVAYDDTGTESLFSNEVTATAASGAPPVETYYALSRAETVYYWLWPGPPATLQRSTNLVPVSVTVTNVLGDVTNRTILVGTNWFDVGPIATGQKVPQTNDYSLPAEYYRVKVTQ